MHLNQNIKVMRMELQLDLRINPRKLLPVIAVT